jgi:hypothetical protein
MMRREKCLVPYISATFILIPLAGSYAWNYTGHRVIASIAYRQLDDETKRKIAEILKKHPASADLWANCPTNGPDEILNLLWNASVFPDDARSEPWKRSRFRTHESRLTHFSAASSSTIRCCPCPIVARDDLAAADVSSSSLIWEVRVSRYLIVTCSIQDTRQS